MGRYATREETMAVQAAGHEIACHTSPHLDCGGARARHDRGGRGAQPCRPTTGARGEPTNFAYPFGDCPAARQGRRSPPATRCCAALHPGLIEDGSDLNQAPGVGIEGPDGEAVARAWLDRAIRRRAWLILYTHDVAERPTAWGCAPDALARLIDRRWRRVRGGHGGAGLRATGELATCTGARPGSRLPTRLR